MKSLVSKKYHNAVLDIGCLSDIGRRRTENQDSFIVRPQESWALASGAGQLLVIADGMGGHSRGREASRQTVQCVAREYFLNYKDNGPESLARAFRQANQAIRAESRREGLDMMGTTCSALVLTDEGFFLAHVGDSKIYSIGRSEMIQLTRDHTFVAEMEQRGLLSAEEASESAHRSVLNRALGMEDNVKVDITSRQPFKNIDAFLLCTDGLSNLTEDEICQIVNENDSRNACRKLVQLENKRGGADNITVMVAKIPPGSSWRFPALSKYGKIAAGILLVLALTFAGRFAYFKKVTIHKNLVSSEPGNESTTVITSLMDFDKSLASANTGLPASAHRHFENGELEKALELYDEVLMLKPTHLEAIHGRLAVATSYRQRADRSFEQGNYQLAQSDYSKAFEISRDASVLGRLNVLSRLDNRRQAADSQIVKPVTSAPSTADSEIAPANDETDFAMRGFKPGEWDVRTRGVSFGPSDVTFLRSDEIKKMFLKEKVGDVELTFKVFRDNSVSEAIFGIILGDRVEGGRHESYRLTFVNYEKIRLEKLVNGRPFELMSAPLNLKKDEEELTFRLLFLGPWIMVFLNDEKRTSYLHKEIIRGLLGFFASAETAITLSELNITSPLLTEHDHKRSGR